METERGQIVLKHESVGPEHHYSIISTKQDLLRLSELLAATLRQMPDPLSQTTAINPTGFEVTHTGGCPDVSLTFLVEPDLKKYGVPKPTPS